MFIVYGIITIVLLFMLSAFWSGSETALTSLSKYRIKKIIAVKKSLSKPLMQWLKSPYYLLTTILVGNTVTNLLLSFLATVMVLRLCIPLEIFSRKVTACSFVPGREALEFITWLTVTFLLLIFGEVTPKIFSRNNPEKFTMYSLPVLSKLSAVVRMTVMPIKKFIKTIFPDVGLAPVRRLTSLSLEEIHELISQANSSGVIGKETSQMLERVLKISETSVSKIMTPVENFEAVNLENSEEKVLDLIIETGRSRVPVYRKNAASIQGFVHTKDLLWAWKNKEGRFSEDLIRAPYFVPYDKKIYELMKEFQSGKTHIAFVNDALGNVIGLVTLEDVLEEIVGEILDEYDLEEGETGS